MSINDDIVAIALMSRRLLALAERVPEHEAALIDSAAADAVGLADGLSRLAEIQREGGLADVAIPTLTPSDDDAGESYGRLAARLRNESERADDLAAQLLQASAVEAEAAAELGTLLFRTAHVAAKLAEAQTSER